MSVEWGPEIYTKGPLFLFDTSAMDTACQVLASRMQIIDETEKGKKKYSSGLVFIDSLKGVLFKSSPQLIKAI